MLPPLWRRFQSFFPLYCVFRCFTLRWHWSTVFLVPCFSFRERVISSHATRLSLLRSFRCYLPTVAVEHARRFSSTALASLPRYPLLQAGRHDYLGQLEVVRRGSEGQQNLVVVLVCWLGTYARTRWFHRKES